MTAKRVLTAIGLVIFAQCAAAGAANAAAEVAPPPLTTIFQAIQNLQTSINNLQNAVDKIPTNPTNPRKRFYLTTNNVQGNTALSACATGFHMASMWEIFDLGNVTYDLALGRTTADSGDGPPTAIDGWVRTGFSADASTTIGHGNCRVWTSASGADFGSSVSLTDMWLFQAPGLTVSILPWIPRGAVCAQTLPVWCVQDQ
jgi:hypothetical protein